MFEEYSNSTSTLVDATFHSIEEVNEVAHATGWRGYYRQLGKGAITSRWRSLHLGRSSLVAHQLDNRIHARIAPPAGCVALAIMPPPSHMSVEGVELGNGKVLVTDAATDLVVPARTRCDTLVLPGPDFEASVQALFPHMNTNGESAQVVPCPLSGWSALQVEIGTMLHNGSVDSESMSNLVCRLLDLIAGEAGNSEGESYRCNRSTGRVARLAQAYIEDHYRDPIRMEDLCRFTDVSVRTLQRSFTGYFQMSPLDYLKARRLNAARLALVTGDSSGDHVTVIALDSGFTHLGRFSVDYRKHFCESPRETLARA